jgi:hypothetical protein
VLCEGEIVGRITKAAAAPVGQPWLWTLAHGYHEDRTPLHGHAATREAAIAAFAKSWRREWARGDRDGGRSLSIAKNSNDFNELWRREWDSNPRYGFPYTRFPSVRLKPLGHPSGTVAARAI